MRKIYQLLLLLGLTINVLALEILTPQAPPSIPLLNVKDLEISFYSDVNSEVIPKILKNKTGLVMIPTNVAEKLKAKGVPLKLVGITSEGLISIISKNDYKNFSQLENKSLYIGAQGSSPDVITRYLLNKENVSSNISYRTSPEIAKLIISGKIENAVLPEPLATMALSKNKELKRSFYLSDLWENHNSSRAIPQVGVYATEDFYKKNSEEIEKFISKYKSSLHKIRTNPSSTIVLAQENFKNIKLSKEDYENSINYMGLTFIEENKGQPMIDNYMRILKGE